MAVFFFKIKNNPGRVEYRYDSTLDPDRKINYETPEQNLEKRGPYEKKG